MPDDEQGHLERSDKLKHDDNFKNQVLFSVCVMARHFVYT